MKPRLSLEAKLMLFVCTAATCGVGVVLAIVHFAGAGWIACVVAAVAGLLFIIYTVRRFMAPINRLIGALNDGVASLRDNDFSISIAATRDDELGDLVAHYNRVGDALRAERRNLFQRELLLDTVIQSTPLALVLTTGTGRIVYSNVAARQFFNRGRPLEGASFTELLETAPPTLREAVDRGGDGLFSIETDGEREIYHLSRRAFQLNAQQHNLYLFKILTRELTRQEVNIWKKVIRVISHEINNSLAPISSLSHSGAALARDEQAASIFAAIEERARHLTAFISGYARFAKLPGPQPVDVDWREFLRNLAATTQFQLRGELPQSSSYFDPGQIQQVLINLLKNASESGSPAEAIELSVEQHAQGVHICVADRGPGMSEMVLQNALLPFYSTKQTGTGLGLTLCREIVEAHGGRLSLMNRAGGGLRVTIWLP